MSTALATKGTQELAVTTRDQLDLVRRTVFPNSTDDELQLYVHDCTRQGVHPLDRLIHPTIRKDKQGNRRYTPITSIDLMRSRAEETGAYAGNDDPAFAGSPKGSDFQATATVWKIVGGVRCAFSATARWLEYKPGDDFMWQSKPHVMLGKCAEALAMRKAFPRQLGGLHVQEEMHRVQEDEDTAPVLIPATTAPPQLAAPAPANQEQPLFQVRKAEILAAKDKARLSEIGAQVKADYDKGKLTNDERAALETDYRAIAKALGGQRAANGERTGAGGGVPP